MAEVDKIEKEKRIYQISLLLRRKPTKYIIQFITQKWGLEKRQAYNYIKLARKEWQKYFTNLKHAGISYHIAQMRDLKDTAGSKKDYRLVFDIAKEEAKLMGIYPSEKHDVKVEGELKVTNAKQKLINKVNSIAKRAGEDKTAK